MHEQETTNCPACGASYPVDRRPRDGRCRECRAWLLPPKITNFGGRLEALLGGSTPTDGDPFDQPTVIAPPPTMATYLSEDESDEPSREAELLPLLALMRMTDETERLVPQVSDVAEQIRSHAMHLAQTTDRAGWLDARTTQALASTEQFAKSSGQPLVALETAGSAHTTLIAQLLAQESQQTLGLQRAERTSDVLSLLAAQTSSVAEREEHLVRNTEESAARETRIAASIERQSDQLDAADKQLAWLVGQQEHTPWLLERLATQQHRFANEVAKQAANVSHEAKKHDALAATHSSLNESVALRLHVATKQQAQLDSLASSIANALEEETQRALANAARPHETPLVAEQDDAFTNSLAAQYTRLADDHHALRVLQTTARAETEERLSSRWNEVSARVSEHTNLESASAHTLHLDRELGRVETQSASLAAQIAEIESRWTSTLDALASMELPEDLFEADIQSFSSAIDTVPDAVTTAPDVATVVDRSPVETDVAWVAPREEPVETPAPSATPEVVAAPRSVPFTREEVPDLPPPPSALATVVEDTLPTVETAPIPSLFHAPTQDVAAIAAPTSPVVAEVPRTAPRLAITVTRPRPAPRRPRTADIATEPTAPATTREFLLRGLVGSASIALLFALFASGLRDGFHVAVWGLPGIVGVLCAALPVAVSTRGWWCLSCALPAMLLQSVATADPGVRSSLHATLVSTLACAAPLLAVSTQKSLRVRVLGLVSLVATLALLISPAREVAATTTLHANLLLIVHVLVVALTVVMPRKIPSMVNYAGFALSCAWAGIDLTARTLHGVPVMQHGAPSTILVVGASLATLLGASLAGVVRGSSRA